MERTLVLVKPDAVERGLVSEIAGRFEKRGFKILGLKMSAPGKQLAEQHYQPLASAASFPELTDFLSSGPVLAMVLEGNQVVEAARKMIGPDEAAAAEPGTIRGDLASEDVRNLAESSESAAEAERQISLWFAKDEMVPGECDGQAAAATGSQELPPLGDKFYITTAINYTNGNPHMGHAYEAISSDVFARYHRIFGREVFFLTGTDEHGQKIAETAEKEGVKPQDICDKYANAFQSLNKSCSISNDNYIRTTMSHHKETAQLVWKKAFDNGDIYIDNYKGWYNVKEETFVTDTEAKELDYKDAAGRPLEERKEQSYFFRASKYQKALLKHIHDNPGWIQPESRQKEILSFLKEDLRDLSISRNTFTWGVPVPKDNLKSTGDHVMYVWFDALTNYLSGVGFPNGPNAHFWPASVHIIGKDIIRFHTVTWPCMLMSAGIPLPRCVFAHGFVHANDGQKMSKSLGNVIDPNGLLAKYPSDTFRYFLMTEGSYGGDLSFSEESMLSKHNSILADTLGNLVQRGFAFCHQSCDGKVPDTNAETLFDLSELVQKTERAYNNFQITVAVELAVEKLRDTNKYVTDKEPWKMKNDDPARKVVVRTVLEALYVLCHFLEPLIPDACSKIFDMFNTPPRTIQKLCSPHNLKVGCDVKAPEKKVGLFPKFSAEQTKVQSKQGGAPAAGGDTRLAFQKVLCKVGKVLEVGNHPTADTLFVTKVDVGDESPRTVVAGLKAAYKAEELQGRSVVVVCNLKKAELKGVTSEGMMLVSDDKGVGQKLLEPGTAAVGTLVQLPDKPSDSQDEEITKQQFDKIKFKVKGKKVVVHEQALVAGDQEVVANASDKAKIK